MATRLSRPVVGALLLASALLVLHFAWTRSRHPETYRVRRGELPGFDAYVYVAMAERPTIFTLPPWGYRLLTPALVHTLPLRTALGFRAVTLASLLATATCVALLLRRLGHGPFGVAVGIALFTLSPFVGVFLQDPFLVDPLAVALMAALLLAAESGAGLATLALLATLGTAAKEVMLVLAPLVCWGRRDAVGRGRAVGEAILVVVPALAFEAVLRLRWPAAQPLAARLDAEMASALAAFVARTASHWLLFGGLMPVAVAGALHPSTRTYLRRYGLALVVMLLLPLAYTPLFPQLLHHLRAELPRYGFFALPLLVPVAVGAVAWWRPPVPASEPSDPGAARSRLPSVVVWVATLAVVALPALLLDPYRRADLQGRDGERLLALSRQGLQVAEALGRGEAIVFDVEAEPFLSADEAREAFAVPWFLTEGWEGRREDGRDEVRTRGAASTLVVPILAPRDLRVSLALSAPVDVTLRAHVGETAVGTARAGPATAVATFLIPATALARGENELRLTAEQAVPVRLHRVTLEPGS